MKPRAGVVLAGLLCLGAQGVVFEDANRNGVRDPGEQGLEGVRVSNGTEFATTKADGRWALELAPGSIAFVIKPAGYATPMDENQLPAFYYVHAPEGSPPGLRYPGIEPTGPLPASIDFALLPHEEPGRFKVILFADTQPETAAELDYVRDDVVAELIDADAAFGMTLGDLMFDDLSLLPRYNEILGRIGIPWYNVPGNHDMNFLAADDAGSLDTFKRYYGPPYYSFDYAQAHFVVLDNIVYKGHGQVDLTDYTNPPYETRLGREQLDWLRADLDGVPKDRLVFLTMHSPLGTYVTGGERNTATTHDRRELFALLAGRPHLYAVAGHTHTTEHHYFGPDDGFPGPGELHQHVLATVSGSWWSGPPDERGIPLADQRDGTPNGYHVLEVDGAEVSVRYKAASRPETEQMRIVLDDARVVVNLFDGGPRSSVEMRVGEGPWTALERTLTVDPFVEELFARHPDAVKPWARALPSSHIWVGDLPPGARLLGFRAVDEFGRTHRSSVQVEPKTAGK